MYLLRWLSIEDMQYMSSDVWFTIQHHITCFANNPIIFSLNKKHQPTPQKNPPKLYGGRAEPSIYISTNQKFSSTPIPGRFSAGAHGTGHFVHGQCGTQYEWVSILSLYPRVGWEVGGLGSWKGPEIMGGGEVVVTLGDECLRHGGECFFSINPPRKAFISFFSLSKKNRGDVINVFFLVWGDQW